MNSTSALPKIRKEFLPFGRPNFSDEEIEAVTRVMRSGWVGMGDEVIAFERELAGFLSSPRVVTVNSCTSGLFLSLLVLGIAPGDEVICPSLTWCSTANAALYLGAHPVFCDVEPDTMCVSARTIRPHLTDRTKAVVVVHYGGLAVDVKALREELPAGIHIIEDAAHALGAIYPDGSPVGSSGNLTCFSFYANKNLSTAEGGAISLSDPTIADRLSSLRQHGLSTDAWQRYIKSNIVASYPQHELGYKMNYTDLQAAIGRVQLKRQKEFREIRLRIAQHYIDALSSVPGVGFQAGIIDAGHARHLFIATLPIERMSASRDEFISGMRQRNIGATLHYTPLHLLPLYANYVKMGLPTTEYLSKRIVTLPIGTAMTESDAEYVVAHVADLLSEVRI